MKTQRVVFAPGLGGPNSEHIPLMVSAETLGIAIVEERLAQLGQFLGLVHGGIDDPIDTGLSAALSLHRGLKRPKIDNHEDELIYVYACKPECTFRAILLGGPYDGVDVAAEKAPDSSVFVVYADIPDSVSDPKLKDWSEEAGKPIRGKIESWEWLLAAPNEPTLPAVHAARYVSRIW